MTSGKGDGFQGAQRQWLDKVTPEYLLKTGAGKRHEPGQPAPKDDSDLRDWVTKKLNEFEVKFKAELEVQANQEGNSAQKIRERFHAWFRNKKARTNTQHRQRGATTTLGSLSTSSSSHSTPIPTSTPPQDVELLWKSLLQRRKLTGQDIFNQSVRSTVSSELNAERRQDSISAKHHAGMLQKRLKAQWEGLTEAEQDVWHQKAKNDSEDSARGSLEWNQSMLSNNLSVLLSDIIGPISEGSHKIGNARFHVLYAYRNEDEDLVTGCLDVTNNGIGEHISFDSLVDNYDNITTSWQACCSKTVTANRSSAYTTRFTFNEEGCPLLPPIDSNTTTLDRIRTILSEYLHAHWLWSKSFTVGKSGKVPYDVPWLRVSQHLRAPLLNVVNPANADPIALFGLLNQLQSHDGNRIFFPEPLTTLLEPASLSSSATTSAPVPTVQVPASTTSSVHVDTDPSPPTPTSQTSATGAIIHPSSTSISRETVVTKSPVPASTQPEPVKSPVPVPSAASQPDSAKSPLPSSNSLHAGISDVSTAATATNTNASLPDLVATSAASTDISMSSTPTTDDSSLAGKSTLPLDSAQNKKVGTERRTTKRPLEEGTEPPSGSNTLDEAVPTKRRKGANKPATEKKTAKKSATATPSTAASDVQPERRSTTRSRRPPAPIQVMTTKLPTEVRKPSFTYGQTPVDADGHPLNEHGERLKF